MIYQNNTTRNQSNLMKIRSIKQSKTYAIPIYYNKNKILEFICLNTMIQVRISKIICLPLSQNIKDHFIHQQQNSVKL